MQPVIMIVEDEPSQLRSLEIFVTERLKMQAFPVSTGREAVDAIMSGALPRIDMLLLDWNMPGFGGADVLASIRPQFPNLPVVVITASDDLKTAVDAMKAGANDFVVKPFSPGRLQVSISNLMKLRHVGDELSRLKRAHGGYTAWDDLAGNSDNFRKAIELGKKASGSSISVLLLGESGVGKEMFARAIHGSSERAGKPFVAVNCGAIPENLVESTLFGHEKGAFTGAHNSALGKFREAEGGTLFLDEIGELRLDLQVKLLRALQQMEVQPVGGKAPVKIDVRIISATNQKLDRLVEAGKFREDLFYRLNVFPIFIPPLRDRKSDIDPLATRFAKAIAATEHKDIIGLKPEAIELLQSVNWPGNVRQLENAVFRAVVMSSSSFLNASDFSFIVGSDRNNGSESPGAASTPSVVMVDQNGEIRDYSEIEKDIFTKAVEICGNSYSQAAKKLGVGRSTLYRKLGVTSQ